MILQRYESVVMKNMMNLEAKKEQEIKNMVTILEQIDLPDIILLVLMVGGGSEKSQELFYLYEALGIVTFAAGAFALECFWYQEHQYRKRKIREAKEHAGGEAA